MKSVSTLVLTLLALGTVSTAQVEITLPYSNPAGIRFTGPGFAPSYAFQAQAPLAPQVQAAAAPIEQQPAEPQPIEAEPIAQPEGPQPLSAAPQPEAAPQLGYATPAHTYTAAAPQLGYATPAHTYTAAAPQLGYATPAHTYTAAAPQLGYATPAHTYTAASPHLGYATPAHTYTAAAPAYTAAAPAYTAAAPAYTAAAPAYTAAAPVYTAAAPAYAPVAPVAPIQYHRAVEYAAPVAPVVHQKVAYAAQPALAVHQKIGYAATPVVANVPGVADVPVTKLAYSQGYTQHEVDVAQPAVSTRKVKVRRPALRKEFYDIEHRVVVRPAGSATLELSQPISKEQQGPAVLTPTKFAHLAPVVRYGASRRIIDGEQSAVPATRGATLPPVPQPPQQPAGPRSASPPAPSAQPPAQPQPQPESAQPRQALDEDTEVIEATRGREDAPSDAPQPINDQTAPPAGPPAEGPAPPTQDNGQGLTITPDMPLALQNRLLELLTSKGGTVTEVLNKDGTAADSASVLQVADALGDPSLQGGERITTRRIVVTRPIETIQEIEVQEPATKIHRKLVQQPALFKHHVPAVARVPVSVPTVKHLATPVVKTTYAAAVPAYGFNYHA